MRVLLHVTCMTALLVSEPNSLVLVELASIRPMACSGYTGSAPALMVATNEKTNEDVRQLVASNAEQRVYGWCKHDDKLVYFYLFAPATRVGCGWDIQIRDVFIDPDLDGGTLVIDVLFIEPIGPASLPKARARWSSFVLGTKQLAQVEKFQLRYVVERRSIVEPTTPK